MQVSVWQIDFKSPKLLLVFRRQDFDVGNSEQKSFTFGSLRSKLPQVRAESLAVHSLERRATSNVVQHLTEHRISCKIWGFKVGDYDMTPSSLVDNYQRFGETSCTHLHGRRRLSFVLRYSFQIAELFNSLQLVSEQYKVQNHWIWDLFQRPKL
jgi:hypothetical protein